MTANRFTAFVLFIIGMLDTTVQAADTNPADSTRGTSARSLKAATPFDHLGSNMVRTVTGWPLALHAAGGLSTWSLVSSGADARVLREVSQHNRVTNAVVAGPGLMTGTLAPLVVPLSLYYLPDDPEWRTTGAVAMQAVGLSFAYNNLLKALTGRPPPDASQPNLQSHSEEFRFGFLRGGVFHGWPSGHTMVNTALATSIASYHRETVWAVPAALAYSTYVGTSMVLGDRGEIHWLSDATAGFLMGVGIGWMVGDGFHKARKGAGRNRSAAHERILDRWTLVPVVGLEQGVVAVTTF